MPAAIVGALGVLLFAPFKLLGWGLTLLAMLAVRGGLLVWRGFTTVVLPVIAKVGEVVLRPYDAAAEAYRHRILPAALRNPALVLGSAGLAFLLSLFDSA